MSKSDERRRAEEVAARTKAARLAPRDRELSDAELEGVAAGVKGGNPPDPPQTKP